MPSEPEPKKRGRPKGCKDKVKRASKGKKPPKEKPYPPRQKKRMPRPPRTPKEAARSEYFREHPPTGGGRPLGSRDARIILAEFGQLTIDEIKKKAQDPETSIHDRAYLARWLRAQADERTMENIENRIYGNLTAKTELTGKDGGPIQTDSMDLSQLSYEDLVALRAIRDKVMARASGASDIR